MNHGDVPVHHRLSFILAGVLDAHLAQCGDTAVSASMLEALVFMPAVSRMYFLTLEAITRTSVGCGAVAVLNGTISCSPVVVEAALQEKPRKPNQGGFDSFGRRDYL